MKKIIIIMTMVTLIAGILTAFEGDCREGERNFRKGMHSGKHPGMMQNEMDHFRMAEELDLTEKQKDEIEVFQIENQKEMVDLQADLKKLAIDQKAAHRDHDFAKIRSLTKKIFELKEDLALQRIELKEKRWNILTEEQKEKAEELMKDRKFHSEQMIEKWKK